MKYLSLFSGIGAFEKALTRLGIEYKLVGFSEIDKYAIKSYCAIHGVDESLNLGDIASIDLDELKKLEEIDLITHGSPCQDFSIAGRLAGGDKGSGTRSSLMWCTVDIVEAVRPKYVVWENVKNLLSAKNRHNFDGYLEIMDTLGYNNYYKVLNAKNYGIPQNRERVFTISIRKDIDENDFEFPKPIELKLKLKDMLEDEVDKKYYINDGTLNNILSNNQAGFLSGGKWDKINESCRRYYKEDGISPSIHTCQGGNTEPKVLINEPVIAASRGRNPDNPSDRTPGIPTEQRLEINKQGVSNTITTVQKDNYVLEPKNIINLINNSAKHQQDLVQDAKGICKTIPAGTHGSTPHLLKTIVSDTPLRVRKLTPKECWRLMGFTDEDFNKAQGAGMSNTQLYKQARKQYCSKCIRSNIQEFI